MSHTPTSTNWRVLTDVPGFDWQQESLHNTKFGDLKSQCLTSSKYEQTFASLLEGSDMNLSRRWLRDFWDKVLETIPKDHDLWRPTHPSALLMKARNHLELMEPIDEAVFKKANLWQGSGSYWAGCNRPKRYDTIEELLITHQNGNIDPNTQELVHESRRVRLFKMLGTNLQKTLREAPQLSYSDIEAVALTAHTPEEKNG
jgi:hypothetical protein